MIHFKNALSPIIAVMVFVGVFLISCEDGKDTLFNTEDADFLELKVYITNPADSNIESQNLPLADTIQTGDSIYLHARIKPNSFQIQEYYWVFHDVAKSNYFTVLRSWDSAGDYAPRFYAIDARGDTLEAQLNISVNTVPDSISLTLPKNQGTGIPIFMENGIHLEWYASDPDGDSLLHHLKVWETDDKSGSSTLVLDTLLNETFFDWITELKPLQTYSWQVVSYDRVQMHIASPIHFFTTTSHDGNQTKVRGKVSLDGRNQHDRILVSARDFLGKVSHDTTNASGLYTLQPLNPGPIALIFRHLDLTDYNPDSLTVTTLPGQSQVAEDLTLLDKTSPKLHFISSLDLLSLPHTLEFSILDSGSGLNDSSVQITIDGQEYNDFLQKTDTSFQVRHLGGFQTGTHTLKIVFKDNSRKSRTVDTTFRSRFYALDLLDTVFASGTGKVVVEVTAAAGSRPFSKYYYKRESSSIWSISSEAKRIFDFASTGSEMVHIIAEGSDGEVVEDSIIVHIFEAPLKPFPEKPGYQRTVTRDSSFVWTSALSSDSLPVVYSIEYQLDGESTWNPLVDSLADTTYPLTALPTGIIRWKVHARDSLGGGRTLRSKAPLLWRHLHDQHVQNNPPNSS